jgi:putative spermidine/putrescine transport system permease protein
VSHSGRAADAAARGNQAGAALSAERSSRRAYIALWLAWPSLALFGTVVIPFALLLRISLAAPDPSGLWKSVFTLDTYGGLLNHEFGGALLYSLGVASLVAALTVGSGFPLTYFITRMERRWQVVWLVFLLVSLSLSDVLNAFSWQLMLSKHGGLASLAVLVGIMSRPESLTPSNGAVWASLVYGVLPFTVMTLYPSLSQLAPEVVEAARTLGASPFRAFHTVVVPMTRRPALVAFMISAILTLGAYVSPLVLGRPQSWTLAVLIGNTALAGHDIPRAAAMSVCLLAAVSLLGAVALLGTLTLQVIRQRRTG